MGAFSDQWLQGGLQATGPALAGFLVAAIAVMLLRPLALRVGLVDKPGGRKTHAAPTPVVGGLSIAAGSVAAMLLIHDFSPSILGLGLAAAILLITGLLDDLYDIRWPVRISAQAAAALVLCLVGGVKVELIGQALGFEHASLGALSVPFTVVATVGIINALNMADGIDGLAGMLTLTTTAMLATAAVYAGDLPLAASLAGLMGAIAAFLVFNLRTPWRARASIFLGNAGSEVLGLMIAWAAFRLTQNPAHPVSPVLAPFLIAPPVIDCLVLMVRRLRDGGSPFSADRGHMHHLLLDAGYTVTGVAVAITLGSMSLGLAAAVALRINIPEPLFLVAFLGLTGAYFLVSARWARAVGLFAALRVWDGARNQPEKQAEIMPFQPRVPVDLEPAAEPAPRRRAGKGK